MRIVHSAHVQVVTSSIPIGLRIAEGLNIAIKNWSWKSLKKTSYFWIKGSYALKSIYPSRGILKNGHVFAFTPHWMRLKVSHDKFTLSENGILSLEVGGDKVALSNHRDNS